MSINIMMGPLVLRFCLQLYSEATPISIGSVVPNCLKLTTKVHDCASRPSSAQGVQTIGVVHASDPLCPQVTNQQDMVNL